MALTIRHIGWSLPGTNPVLTGVLLPAHAEGREMTAATYRMHIGSRLNSLAENARAGAARAHMVRVLHVLGWDAFEGASRVWLGPTLDLLDERPELFDAVTDTAADKSWPKIVRHDPDAYAAVNQSTLEDWVEAMIRSSHPDWRRVGEMTERVRARQRA